MRWNLRGLVACAAHRLPISAGRAALDAAAGDVVLAELHTAVPAGVLPIREVDAVLDALEMPITDHVVRMELGVTDHAVPAGDTTDALFRGHGFTFFLHV